MHRALNPGDAEYFLPVPDWPEKLVLPPRPPHLVHVDLAHWIRFGRVVQGRGDSEYARLLDALRTAVVARRIRIVLSGAQYREILKIKDPAQRQALAEIVEELTDFTYLAGHVEIMRLEMECTLNRLTPTTGIDWTAIDLLGQSALNVVGRKGGLRIMQEGEDVTASLLAEDPEWEARLAAMNRMAEQMLLRGPSDEEAEEIRADGYAPERAEQQLVNNATLENAWSEQIAPHRANYSLRRLVSARYLYLELNEMLAAELQARGLRLEDLFPSPEHADRFVLSMPSSAVTVSMKAQYHQDASRVWTANDMYDIDALALSLPYCDVVFADASTRDAAIRRGLDRHFSTFLPRKPADLVEHLQRPSQAS